MLLLLLLRLTTDGHKASSDLSATAELLFFCFSRVVDYAGYTHQLFPAR